jgi:hypothetical protein
MFGSETSTVTAPSLRYSAMAASTACATSAERPSAKNSFGRPIFRPASGFSRSPA